jgi:hypothetical protein
MRVKLRGISSRSALIALALLTEFHPAYSHGIAGNRYFDGTLTFDDPAVADEAILPYYTHLEYPTLGSTVVENRFNWSFTRLLTPTLAVTFDSGWIHQNWATPRGLLQLMLVSNTKPFATTGMRRWCRWALPGVSDTREPNE